MTRELQKPLTDRVKELLQTDGEHSLFELAELLRQFRNETHPDKFQDGDLKAKAEARFKEAQSLLEEIERQLELDRFNRKPSELAVYKPLYDVAQLQRELDTIKKQLENTKAELENERRNTVALNKKLQSKKEDSLSAEIQHLQSIYRPSTRGYASIGLAIVLSGALGVMSQMEHVSLFLKKYSPFGERYIGTGLFLCFIFFLATMLRKIWERDYIRRKSEEVCSPKYADEFMQYMKSRILPDTPILEYSEAHVFDFISGRRHWFKKAIRGLGFHIFGPESINRLKDIFIHNLLNKKLIEVSRAEKMQRYFSISSVRPNWEWYHEYMTKKDKKHTDSASSVSEDQAIDET